MSPRSTPPPTPEPDRRLLHAALFLSAASAALSAYAAFGRPPSAPASDDPAALRAEIAQLRKALDAKADTGQLAGSIQRLHERIDQLEARRAQTPPSAAGGDDPGPAPPTPSSSAAASTGEARSASTIRRFVEIVAPAKGITVKELSDGTFSVTNTDPALTGQTMIVKGKSADGTERDISITVPAP